MTVLNLGITNISNTSTLNLQNRGIASPVNSGNFNLTPFG